MTFNKEKVKGYFKSAIDFIVKISKIVFCFLKENIEITSTKKSKIVAAILGGALLVVTLVDVTAYTSLDFKAKWLLLAFTLLMPFILAAITAYTIKIKHDLTDKIVHGALILLLPFVSMTMTECLNNVCVFDMTGLGVLGNYIVIVILMFIVIAASGNIGLSVLIVNPIIFGFAVAHSYIMDFRGTPFIPMDFLGIKTAMNVSNTYKFTLTHKVLTGTLIFIFLIILGIKLKTPKYKLTTKVIARSFAGAFAAVLLILFYGTSVFADAGVKPDFWNQTRGYHNYGFVFNFFCNTKYLYISEPEGYDPNKVESFVSDVVGDEVNTVEPNEASPNLICIMNESLSDLSTLGQLETNEDYMPFMRSLTENTVKGNLYVPVVGAGTSNTEFEFLTGHSTAFLPSGSNAYMLYVKNPIASLVSTMQGQGYSSFAFHPYYASGWNRPAVYGNLGFTKFVSLENIIDITLMDDFQDNGSDPNYLQQLLDQRYQGENMIIRQYISDSYDYKYLIKDFEARDKSVPYFAFNVTMQNHGGYTTSADNFDECIFATNVTKEYTKANKYLSLVKASDNAFRELISYFSTVKEPTVICMFGDHQPSVETSFISEIMGVKDLSNLSVEDEQKRHVTPFYIWANYDIPEQQIDKISSNYLSSLVLQTANIKMPEYNRYLLKLSKTLPVIDTVGYIDNNGVYYKWSDASQYTSLLDEYEKIQYNNIFDQTNKNTKVFYLDGYTPAYLAEGTKK